MLQGIKCLNFKNKFHCLLYLLLSLISTLNFRFYSHYLLKQSVIQLNEINIHTHSQSHACRHTCFLALGFFSKPLMLIKYLASALEEPQDFCEGSDITSLELPDYLNWNDPCLIPVLLHWVCFGVQTGGALGKLHSTAMCLKTVQLQIQLITGSSHEGKT